MFLVSYQLYFEFELPRLLQEGYCMTERRVWRGFHAGNRFDAPRRSRSFVVPTQLSTQLNAVNKRCPPGTIKAIYSPDDEPDYVVSAKRRQIINNKNK